MPNTIEFLAEAYTLACRKCGVDIDDISFEYNCGLDGEELRESFPQEMPACGWHCVLLYADAAPFSIMFIASADNPVDSVTMYSQGDVIGDDMRIAFPAGDAAALADGIADIWNEVLSDCGSTEFMTDEPESFAMDGQEFH